MIDINCLEKMIIERLPVHYQERIKIELSTRNLTLFNFFKIVIGEYFRSKDERKETFLGKNYENPTK